MRFPTRPSSCGWSSSVTCRLLNAGTSEEDRHLMYSKEKILEILEAYDLTKSFRSAAALIGCDHHTVARYVAARAAGLDPSTDIDRPTVPEPFVDKINEWIDRSDGRIRADVVHEKLEAMGYPGSERTTRRVVAALKEQWRRVVASGLHAVDHRTWACGCSGTTRRGRCWPDSGSCCSLPGWRGHGSGSWSRCGTARCRR